MTCLPPWNHKVLVPLQAGGSGTGFGQVVLIARGLNLGTDPTEHLSRV